MELRTVLQAAERLNTSERHVRRLVDERRIESRPHRPQDPRLVADPGRVHQPWPSPGNGGRVSFGEYATRRVTERT
jgi:hypothetical protein